MKTDTTKNVYIDIYHPVFGDDGFTAKDVIHLTSIDINTDINIGEIVYKMKLDILEYYGDGLYIESEEFGQMCYINIFIMFGTEYKFLVEYLDSINIKQDKTFQKVKSGRDMFLSVEHFFNQKETEELITLLSNLGIETRIYLIKRKAFERGAGDYHENVILSFISGAAATLGSRLTNLLMDKYDVHQNPRITKLNTEKILDHVSKETGINRQDLHISKIEDIGGDKTEIIIINRYKSIKLVYEKSSNNINYEVINKTQTMI